MDSKYQNAAATMLHGGWIEKCARFGYAAKGVVYCLIGALTTMAAFGLGGKTAGKTDVLNTIIEQPFGKILLGIVALGLVSYSIWRFIQTIRDTEHKGSDAKGWASRLGFAVSGLIYLAFAFSAAAMIFPDLGGGSSNGEQSMVAKLLEQPFGKWMVGIVALIIIGKGIYQFYKAFTGSFMKKIQLSGMQYREMFNRAGRIGYTSRGILLLIIGYFFVRAALEANASEVQGTGGAFDFLQNSAGGFLMGMVAIGLIGYGVFMFVKARFRRVEA